MLRPHKLLVFWLICSPGSVLPLDLAFGRPQLGGTALFSYSSATAQITSTEQRLGFGIAAAVELALGGESFLWLASLVRSPLLALQPGAHTVDLCSEGYFKNLFSLPGACVQYQARMLLAWQRFFIKPGVAYAYNYHSDLSYRTNRLFNSEWAYHAIAPTILVDLRSSATRLQVHAYAAFDVGVYSVTLTEQRIAAWQILLGIYALVRL